MKTVNKYILASCAFCYFAGLYIIATKIGIMRLISQFGLSRAFKEWPADFPSLNLLWICLALYTVCFGLITYWIYTSGKRHGEAMDDLQQKAQAVHNYAESLSRVVARYNRICKTKNIPNKMQSQRLQLLVRLMASLPASAYSSSGTGSRLAMMVNDIDDAVSNIENRTESEVVASNIQLSNLVEQAIEDVQQMKVHLTTSK